MAPIPGRLRVTGPRTTARPSIDVSDGPPGRAIAGTGAFTSSCARTRRDEAAAETETEGWQKSSSTSAVISGPRGRTRVPGRLPARHALPAQEQLQLQQFGGGAQQKDALASVMP